MRDYIHFVGIGGIGVSALAQLALARGSRVSGSDSEAEPETNPALARLIRDGAKYYRGHLAENLASDVNLVVATAAVADSNPEVTSAHARGVRVVSRAAYLGELMAAHRGPKVAIAGTHGKTTTTGMLGVVLQYAGLDPTVFVGGEIAQLGGNIRIGSPDGPFIAEACEAYDSFLHLKPDIAVVTNVEADHLDHYGTEARVIEAFERFLEGVANDGSVVACEDDPGVREMLNKVRSGERVNPVTYGIERDGVDFTARSVRLGEYSEFIAAGGRVGEALPLRLKVPGRHNIENALAAFAASSLLGVEPARIAEGIGTFSGASRRQDILGERTVKGGRALVIDDYAHHPTEIRATLDALRAAYPERRQVVVFQPHLYSRTRDFLVEFAASLSSVDVLIVTDIYPAREAPIEGVRAEAIVELALRKRGALAARYVADQHEIPAVLESIVRSGDVVVIMGAGDIRAQGESFVGKRAQTEEAA